MRVSDEKLKEILACEPIEGCSPFADACYDLRDLRAAARPILAYFGTDTWEDGDGQPITDKIEALRKALEER